MKNSKRRNFVKLLPYALGGVFTYPITKFIFFSDNSNKKIVLSLKNINNGITHLKENQIFIYKKEDQLKIYDAHCTHMGCLLNFDNHLGILLSDMIE